MTQTDGVFDVAVSRVDNTRQLLTMHGHLFIFLLREVRT